MTDSPNNINSVAGIRFTSFQLQNRAGKNKTVLRQTAQTEIIQFSLQVKTDTGQSIQVQNALAHFNQLDEDLKSSLLYDGNPIAGLSSEDAAELVSENGYFGVNQTSQRIIDFVINGAGNDIDRLKSGREGILKGFKAAEEAWGGKLPEISYQTLEKSLEAIDEKIREYGSSVIDLST